MNVSILDKIFINIKSSDNLHFDECLAGAYIPGIKLIQTSREPHIVIEHVQSSKKELLLHDNHLIIKDEWNKEFPLDFYHLLYSVVRTELFKNSFFPIHAACVGSEEQILIVGHSGVGKTAIILKLLADHGIHIFSGNKTLVSFKAGSISTVAGTETITTVDKYKEKYSSLISSHTQYGDRIAYSLNKECYAPPGRIKAIVLVRLNDGAEEKLTLTEMSALHKLYPYFLDVINADTIVCDGQGVYVGTPPTGTQERLVPQLQEALAKISTYSINGTIDFICDSISKL